MPTSSQHPHYKLGKQPKKFDTRTLQLGRYLPMLPTPPSMIDHASRLPADVGMMGNDRLGDCTIAAAGHMVQSWSTYAERGTITISDRDIIAAYRTLSPGDTGCYMLDVLNYWRKTGIGNDKVEAFVEIQAGNLAQAKLAIQYYGSAYLGLALPDQNTFGPWEQVTGPPNPYNGHAINVCQYDDANKVFTAITWGQKVRMSYAWYQRYCDEGYAVLNDISLLQQSGKSPEGFDWNALQYDLAHLGDPVTPVPTPTPTPQPTVVVTITQDQTVVVRADNLGQPHYYGTEREAVTAALNALAMSPDVEHIVRPGAVHIKLIPRPAGA